MDSENPNNGIALEYTFLITDGNIVYVISKLGLTEEQDVEQKDAKELDNTLKLVHEVFNPSNAFKFVKQVTLCKKIKHHSRRVETQTCGCAKLNEQPTAKLSPVSQTIQKFNSSASKLVT